jgi:hypothetical protein
VGRPGDIAVQLTEAPQNQKDHIKVVTNQRMTDLAALVASPPGIFIPNVLQFIRFFEHKDVGDIIRKIQQ